MQLADIWRRRDLPRDGKAPVLVQVPGGAWVIGMRRPQAYPLMSEMAARGWVCVSLGYRVSPRAHLARPHRRRQTSAGLGQGQHRRLRRRPRLRRDHRRVGRRPSVRVGGADPERPHISAGLRRRRHVGGRRGSDVRTLRLVLHPRRRPPRIRGLLEKLVVKLKFAHPPRRLSSMLRRSGSCAPTRHRSSSCTAPTIP